MFFLKKGAICKIPFRLHSALYVCAACLLAKIVALIIIYRKSKQYKKNYQNNDGPVIFFFAQ